MLVLDSANPRAFAGVLRRLRTELGKLPGRPVTGPLLALLPAQGPGLTLDELRGADDAAIAPRCRCLARLLGPCRQLADEVGERYFTLAHGTDQRV
jgi:uncharacterized alpha-E superfamily protein